jgi:hypothetical protein
MDHDERHLYGIKAMTTSALLLIPLWMWKKARWAAVKKRQVAFLRRRKEE